MNTLQSTTSPIFNTDLIRDLLNFFAGAAIINPHRPVPVPAPAYTPKQVALYHYMSRILHSSKPQEYWVLEYPTDESIDLWYIHSSGLLDEHPPGDLFDHLSFVSHIPPNDDHLARELFLDLKTLLSFVYSFKGFI